MRKITIRNLKSEKAAKPRLFDAIVDGNEVFFEVKASKGNAVVQLNCVAVFMIPYSFILVS